MLTFLIACAEPRFATAEEACEALIVASCECAVSHEWDDTTRGTLIGACLAEMPPCESFVSDVAMTYADMDEADLLAAWTCTAEARRADCESAPTDCGW